MAVAGMGLGACAGQPQGQLAGAPGAVPAPVREELDRLRSELAAQRALIELQRRTSIEIVDRRSVELRTELLAVQQALQASLRHVEQEIEEARTATRPAVPAEIPAGLARLEAEVAALSSAVTAVREAVTRAEERAAAAESAARPPSPPADEAVGDPVARLRILASRSAEVAAAAYVQLGDLAADSGNRSRAVSEYRRALEVAPRGADAPRALLRLGDAYRGGGKTRQAREAWRRLVREHPSSEEARIARDRLTGRP